MHQVSIGHQKIILFIKFFFLKSKSFYIGKILSLAYSVVDSKNEMTHPGNGSLDNSGIHMALGMAYA